MFHFKQFSISQQKSAMKVGTDGVLLGAWTPLHYEKSILDIGTGTGLIALMLAQKTTATMIDAIEIDEDAYHEANINFQHSPWSNRLQIKNTSLQAYTTLQKYDLIVANPPYFTDTFKDTSTKRTLARHVGNLTFKDLLINTARLLTANGCCAFIIPYTEETNFVSLAREQGLYPKLITRVKGRLHTSVKRSLLYFTKADALCKQNELVIEKDRHLYTSAYINLTKSFYLNM